MSLRAVLSRAQTDLICWFLFFFFKQKTAYELRISDWSSDVCSSDLRAAACAVLRKRPDDPGIHRARRRTGAADPGSPEPGRSEEHTSELQSLMRISYAVFCLKKKK